MVPVVQLGASMGTAVAVYIFGGIMCCSPAWRCRDAVEVGAIGGERMERYVSDCNTALWERITGREGRLEEALDRQASASLSEDYNAARERVALLENSCATNWKQRQVSTGTRHAPFKVLAGIHCIGHKESDRIFRSRNREVPEDCSS
ncbi:hypothetical protein SAMN05216308_101317 [Nitrosospira sp. Nsp13]|nr:hypothetical protein SAMN05216308_101317 [Nitrosospira sp. Nsp13]